MHLYQVLAQRVDEWRRQGYPHAEFATIAEILEWAAGPEGGGFRLRPPQVRALEAYWYLRLVERTPHIVELYTRLFPRQTERLTALGLMDQEIRDYAADYGMPELFERIKTDDEFVRQYRLEALRETLTLDYPSYILALAMGAGKTVLIGAIFATEFAMAMEYPDGPFVQNALVFAPGLTIVTALRELAETHYDRILPPRLYKPFAASVKLTFTREGERDIPVIRRSLFNVVVTNTEKIRVQKESVRKGMLGPLFGSQKQDEARQEVANLRLQAIASLPHLAVFSDEAHHTYGQALDTELKKVRKTVDYLAAQTNVVCVVNTTGTPYYQRQPLRDVVIWYGLSEGIRDGILKEVSDNIRAYRFDDDAGVYVGHVVEDFFKDYGDVSLPDGTPAKLAIYFPQTDDVRALRPVIEARLMAIGLSPGLVLEHHTGNENKADFDRFKFKDSTHRIALLVDRGVEGWDVPALFACALARRLKSSNNFVLQAASRCLRQVPGNQARARIYLSVDNYGILDAQLQETYGETITELERTTVRSRHAQIRLRKLDIPPLIVRRLIRNIVPMPGEGASPLRLERPPAASAEGGSGLTELRYTISEQQATARVLKQIEDEIEVATVPATTSVYSAAVELVAAYRLDLWAVYDELRRLYAAGGNGYEMPLADLPELARQIEEQTRRYEVQEEVVEVALALVRPDGFVKQTDEDGTEIYTAEITYPIDKERLLVSWEAMREQNGEDFGFHYTPYNFDSNPELSFFEQVLSHANLHPGQVEDIYFTGALTTPDKTDFRIEYLGDDGRWHHYTPDFVIRRKDGRCLVVEIKDARFQAATDEDLERDDRGQKVLTVEGRKAAALRRWEQLSPERLKYELIFERDGTLAYDQIRAAREFMEE